MPAFLQGQHPSHAQFHPQAQKPAGDRYDEVLYGHDDQQQHGDHDEQQAYADEEYAEEPMDGPPAFLESETRRRRTGGLLTVAVVLGLAVVGTAGAYAYRSYSGSPRSGTPPVIKADNAPSKVVPPTQASDPSGKQIYDRIGGAGGPERVVSREEQPVDVNAAAARPAFPAVGQSAAPSQSAASGTDDSSGDAQPRKIRTVPIRGDQSNGAAGAARQVAPAPTAVRTVPVQNAAPVANAPMSLSPNAAPSNVRSASAAVPPAAAAPTNVARTSGAYSVQIASQKTEAEAQASARAAQGQYANVLGGDVTGRQALRCRR